VCDTSLVIGVLVRIYLYILFLKPLLIKTNVINNVPNKIVFCYFYVQECKVG